MNEDNMQTNHTTSDSSSESVHSSSGTSEPSPEQKQEISKRVEEGMGLSDIQKKINTDFGIVMTYMDVRFLVDDLNLDLVEEEEPVASPDPQDDLSSEQEAEQSSGVRLEVDGVTPPGAMASGSVIFSDGESKKWSIDQFGRLALTGGTDGYKPSDEDVMDFQKQLEASLRGPSL